VAVPKWKTVNKTTAAVGLARSASRGEKGAGVQGATGEEYDWAWTVQDHAAHAYIDACGVLLLFVSKEEKLSGIVG
jgi:hypothetical protein